MASFDPEERVALRSSTDANSNFGPDMVKYPLKQVELSIHKFVKVLDIDLDRLYKHTVNISRFTTEEDWRSLHKEQVNASRTVQQIKANIKEIEKARKRVRDEDLDQFDKRVKDVKLKAVVAVTEFLPFVGMEGQMETATGQRESASESTHSSGSSQNDSSPEGEPRQPAVVNSRRMMSVVSSDVSSQHYGHQCDSPDGDDPSMTPYGSLPATMTMMPAPVVTVDLHVVPQNSDASVSWEHLQEDILGLNELVHHFASEVEQQGEVVNSIEDNIEAAHHNVREATTNLAKASKYKAAIYPVVGGMMGLVVGGPVGFLAGLKIGAAAGALGGAVGFAGGRYIKKRQNKIIDIELSNMSDNRAMSLPNLPPEETNIRRMDPDPPDDSSCQDDCSSGTVSKTFSTVSGSFKRLFSSSDEKG